MKRNKYVFGIAAACIVLIASCIAVGSLISGQITSMPNTRQAAHAPGANFTTTITSGVAPLVVRFIDSSTGSPTAWQWDFGDGANATEQNPSHTYKAAGKYTVSLIATNTRGSNATTKTGYITVKDAQPTSGWITIIDDEFNAPGLP